jgi:hypothetical protein
MQEQHCLDPNEAERELPKCFNLIDC